jgi:acyl-CoA synthetase (AMP-forming)/AMP-acid ligase II
LQGTPDSVELSIYPDLSVQHPAMKGRSFGQVKLCLSGAAPLGGELMIQMAKVFPNSFIGQGFGMTEACTIAMLSPDSKIGTLGSAGMLIPGVMAKVLKADGSFGKEGEQGELAVTGPGLALEYHSNPTA